MTAFAKAMVAYFFFLALLALAFAMMWAGASDAHEWYEYMCCAEHDCHPVPDGVVNDAPDGGVDVQGYGHVPPTSNKLRDSQDTKDHICIHLDNLQCVYHVHRSF